MRGASLAAMVTSLHGRAGKTFLARALADYLSCPMISDQLDREHGFDLGLPSDAVNRRKLSSSSGAC
jgi:hypothetical protein